MSPQERIAHYRITAKLGQGGMGAVYRATDTKLNRDVAIKVLPNSFAADPGRLARFTREAQVLASLNHPNIGAIYGVEERALVLELVDGPTLAERIAQGPLAAEEALPVIHQLIDALEYAHEKGVVHRDLKPANIKITGAASGRPGHVKVLDFGLAKAMSAGAAVGAEAAAGDPGSSPTLTMRDTLKGVILGTAGYMAPEQARGHDADKRADIWAFGAVVYEMLTGEQLFGGPTVSDALAAVLTREPVLERVPPAFRKLVRFCLVKDARQRLRDIGDARLALADVDGTPAALPSARRRLPWIVAAVAVLGMLGMAAAWLRRPAEEPRAVKFTIPPPAKSSFIPGTPAVSPDGRRIAFAATADGKSLIWVRDLDSMAARPLAATEGVPVNAPLTSFWSPDSRFVAFFAGGKLKKIEAAGGPAITLCGAPALPVGGSWGRRDTIVFAGVSTGGLLQVPAAGGDPVPVTELDSARGETTHRYPWFLPDGRHFLFLATSTDPEKTAIWVGDLESKTRRHVVTASSNAAYDPRGLVLFLRENTLVAQPFDAGRLETAGDPFPVAEQVDYVPFISIGHFSLSETGVLAYYSGTTARRRLTWLDRAGKPLGTVGTAALLTRQPAISPDGAAVAIDRDDQLGINIWLHDLAHATDSRFTLGARDRYPVWSPDGNRILFLSSRAGKYGLYVKPATGTGKEELLVESPPVKRPTDWSRDGKFVIYSEIETRTGTDIWVLPNPLGDAASRKPFAFLATDAQESDGKLSPDGKYLAYQSDESHTFQVYVQSFPGKEAKFLISTNGGTRPVWSRDGKELFYIAAGGKMMGVDVKTGAVRFEHGNPKPLFDARTPPLAVFDISRDSKKFLMIQQDDESNALSLILNSNWRAGLKK